MKRFSLLLAFACLVGMAHAQYNTMRIPDTLSGTTFDLTARDTFCQIVRGNQTVTGSYNGDIWGPTLFFKKGEIVHLNVHNQLTDTTTVHWHGMHLPAIMDGGPHQTIPPYTTWSPYWKVDNNAGTYWYHPHLDMQAMAQMTMGLGGLIIIRDSIENSLPLPRKYGIDDIPVVITDRKFNSTNQFVEWPYGDSLMTNGTLRAQYTVPAQVVRFRLLDAAIETSYYLGFSDNRTFYVITTDGGLIDTSVGLTRFQLNAGERVEILVNFTGQSGSSVDLKAYNASLANNVPGGDAFAGGPFANFLGHTNYNILHINVGASTSGAITTIPHNLTTNVFPATSSAAINRTVSITDSNAATITTVTITGPNAFVLNHHLFNLSTIDYHVPLNNTEIWTLESTSTFGHPFHIHDVEFYVISINGATPPAYQQGWKDVIFVPARTTIKFIAKFSDYADSLHPYMFHCHIALHEDEGMMGQFVVGNPPAGILDINENSHLKLYPNPTKGKLNFIVDNGTIIQQIEIFNTSGQIVKQMPIITSANEIDVTELPYGHYFLKATGQNNKSYIKSYIKE